MLTLFTSHFQLLREFRFIYFDLQSLPTLSIWKCNTNLQTLSFHPQETKERKFDEIIFFSRNSSNQFSMFSACNKTYTGEVGGGWYSVSVPRPRGDMLPFTCFLSFSTSPASTILILLDTFKLGRFQSHISNGEYILIIQGFIIIMVCTGCPDGHLHIGEGRHGSDPEPGSASGSGLWCGSADNISRKTLWLQKHHFHETLDKWWTTLQAIVEILEIVPF